MALLEAGRRRFARVKGAAALCRERSVSRRGKDRPCTGEGSKTPSPLPEQALLASPSKGNRRREEGGAIGPFGSRQEPASLACGCHHGINLQRGVIRQRR